MSVGCNEPTPEWQNVIVRERLSVIENEPDKVLPIDGLWQVLDEDSE